MADVEEEQEQDVICFDDITGKEQDMPCAGLSELALTYLRELGVYDES